MKKPKIIIFVTTLSSLLFASYLLYFDYKNNPINYIILKRKFEIVSYLFFRDLPAKYPSYNYYFIKYERVNSDQNINYSINQTMESVAIADVKTVYKTKIPQKLRKIFDSYAKLNPKETKDRKIVENITGILEPKGRVLNVDLLYKQDIFLSWDENKFQEKIKEYIGLFSKKFIATSISTSKYDEGCGKNNYEMRIVVDSKPAKALIIGLTNKFTICYLYDEEQINPLKEYEVETLKRAEYKDYWL